MALLMVKHYLRETGDVVHVTSSTLLLEREFLRELIKKTSYALEVSVFPRIIFIEEIIHQLSNSQGVPVQDGHNTENLTR